MSNKADISDEELRKKFPLLFGRNKEESFEVPDGYFDSLPKNVIDKIIAEEQGRVVSINQNRFKWVYAAAGVAAILIIGFLLFSPVGTSDFSEEQLVSLENVEIPMDYVVDFDEDLILEVLYAETNGNDEEVDPYIQYLEEEFETEELIFEL